MRKGDVVLVTKIDKDCELVRVGDVLVVAVDHDGSELLYLQVNGGVAPYRILREGSRGYTVGRHDDRFIVKRIGRIGW